MAQFTRILAVKTGKKFFFGITTAGTSTRCLAENFLLICYSQLINARWQYDDNGSSKFSNWPNYLLPLVQGRSCKERWLKTTTG